MFKVENPLLDSLISISYNNIKYKDKLYGYNIKKEQVDVISSEINTCIFDSVTFKEKIITDIYISDTKFINCDLSNIKFINSSFYRVEFINCKLFGTNIIDSTLSNITFIDCMCRYMNIAGNKIKKIKMSDTNLNESSWIENKLKNIEFSNVDLQNSEIINNPLKDIDLSKCKIYNLKTDIYSIKGCLIDSFQAIDLISLLGVKIKDV